ncbi:hypothetical protein [Burkholderia gladioli]|uniref:Restriction endonuclease subunit S n=1 Tax=Burkholderia gladioli TaxID=28095 RepID=A0AB38TWU6_BURGA|nr:hypothetical protein [Burkholderia gladioli]MBJ9714709.1 hypothetical protein [Burkholderia gladioli]MBU9154935.1 hypothetical protein [Burkholderia gladioli]MBU9191224.1 hypothetical protein [Burkholderia gladioli]MBU9270335.1 hypothetical protein [Burkholderia gladioli]MBU9272823.1 hypothetical protein [Burkholderia gladioli]
MNVLQLENELREAADQLRANLTRASNFLPKLMSGQLDVSGIALPESGVPSQC